MITQEELKNALKYDKDTGVFVWIDCKAGWKNGMVAGGERLSRGIKYRAIGINKKSYLSHRLAWLYEYGHFPTYGVDHDDGNGLNNRINNLFDRTQSDNCRNRKIHSNNKSGTTGVWRDHKKWMVSISVGGKSIHLGYFKDIEDAIKCRKEADIKYGFNPNHGRK